MKAERYKVGSTSSPVFPGSTRFFKTQPQADMSSMTGNAADVFRPAFKEDERLSLQLSADGESSVWLVSPFDSVDKSIKERQKSLGLYPECVTILMQGKQLDVAQTWAANGAHQKACVVWDIVHDMPSWLPMMGMSVSNHGRTLNMVTAAGGGATCEVDHIVRGCCCEIVWRVDRHGGLQDSFGRIQGALTYIGVIAREHCGQTAGNLSNYTGMSSNGELYLNGSIQPQPGAKFGEGDVVGLRIDLRSDPGRLEFIVNDRNVGVLLAISSDRVRPAVSLITRGVCTMLQCQHV